VWLIQAAGVNMSELQIDTTKCSEKIIEGKDYVLQNYWSGDTSAKTTLLNNVFNRGKQRGMIKINYLSFSNGVRGFHNGHYSRLLHNN